jgi:glycosyltransferase involved in cell wall biosynthesis
MNRPIDTLFGRARDLAPTPLVSVIIPHYNDMIALDRCLRSLAEQRYPHEALEIVVADNNTPVELSKLQAIVGDRARLVVVTEKGAGPARNGGAAASNGAILAFIDSDCQAHPDWIRAGVAALSQYDFVGGQVQTLVDNERHMSGAEAFERVFAFDFRSYITKKGFTGTGNLFCPRSLFERVGDFRPEISEDVEWSRRAVSAGFSLGYAHEAIVGHPARRNWVELCAKWRRMNRESFKLRCGTFRGKLFWFFKSLALPASALYHAPKIVASPKLSGWPNKVRAIAMLFRIRLWRAMDGLRLLATTGA